METRKFFMPLASLALVVPLAYAQTATTVVIIDPVEVGTQLQAKTENGINYVCGGIGSNEVQMMKQAASDYDLMLTFAASNGSYLADVNVEIVDPQGQPMLQTKCEGPIMLVDLPKAGNYRIRAEADGHTLNRTARVTSDKKVASVSLAWPTKVVDMGLTPAIRSQQSSGGSDAGDMSSRSSGSSSNTESTHSSGTQDSANTGSPD